MAMFGPAGQMGLGQGGIASRAGTSQPPAFGLGWNGGGSLGTQFAGLRASRNAANSQRMAPMNFYRLIMQMANPSTTSRQQVISPGQTQVIRPSAQAPQRRAAAPQAGASSSLITSTPSPAEVALATTTLLGG